MRTLIKWAGGKTSELETIKKYMPETVNRIVEPFVGGGALFLDMESTKTLANDFSPELIKFYEIVKTSDFFLLNEIISKLHEQRIRALNLPINGRFLEEAAEINSHKSFNQYLDREIKSKIKRIAKINMARAITGDPPLSDDEVAVQYRTAVTAALYYVWREIYNDAHQAQSLDVNHIAYWYVVKQLAFSGMTRYSASGKFNVPYAGISYDLRSLIHNLDVLESAHNSQFYQSTEFSTGDFEQFFEKYDYFEVDDFIFVDPPYDDGFTKYNSKGDFTKEDQIRLRDTLKKSSAKVMVLVKETDFITSLYESDFNIQTFNKNYSVNLKNRNKQDVQHLIITNY